MLKGKKKWLTLAAGLMAALVAVLQPELLPVVDVLAESLGVVPAV